MLKLPDVSLVLIETREHDLAELALEECQSKVEFGDVLVFTDRPSQFIRADRRVITVPDWSEKIGWSKCFWYDVVPHIRTSHVLGIQWDSWITTPEAWIDEFYRYDFIGSIWWYKDGMNVGNGGFSLRSTKFMRYIRNNRTKFPCTTHLDDALYCRTYRPTLEEKGFVWAPERVADHFAFELVEPIRPTFGFHGAFNFVRFLQLEQLAERIRLMRASPGIYDEGNGRIWKVVMRRLRENNPEIVQQLQELSEENSAPQQGMVRP